MSPVNVTGPDAQPEAFETFLEHTQQQIIQVSLMMFWYISRCFTHRRQPNTRLSSL